MNISAVAVPLEDIRYGFGCSMAGSMSSLVKCGGLREVVGYCCRWLSAAPLPT